MSLKKVILVGHCGADTGTLEYAVSQAAPGVAIDSAHSTAELNGLNGDTLLLVNRVLDGSFETGNGVELIAKLAKRENAPAMMLISNYADAQAQAVKAGARPGFGKANAFEKATAELLRKSLGVIEPAKKS